MLNYTPAPKATPQETINELVDHLSAYIEQFHNGSVRVLNFDGKTVTVELGGRCEQCTLSLHTLHGWIQGTLREFYPSVDVVGVAESSGQPIQ